MSPCLWGRDSLGGKFNRADSATPATGVDPRRRVRVTEDQDVFQEKQQSQDSQEIDPVSTIKAQFDVSLFQPILVF